MLKVKEEELNKVSQRVVDLHLSFKQHKKAIYKPTSEIVRVVHADYLHMQVEIEFFDKSMTVVEIDSLGKYEVEDDSMKDSQGHFEAIATELGKFTDEKNRQYGSSVDVTYEMIKVLMERYKNEDSTYTIPQILLQHILLQVRMMDKINRVFNNPSGEGDSESPYRDLTGYSLIGVDMVENK